MMLYLRKSLLVLLIITAIAHSKPTDEEYTPKRTIGSIIWSWLTYPYNWWYGTQKINTSTAPNNTTWCNDQTCTNIKCNASGVCTTITCNIYETDMKGECRVYKTTEIPIDEIITEKSKPDKEQDSIEGEVMQTEQPGDKEEDGKHEVEHKYTTDHIDPKQPSFVKPIVIVDKPIMLEDIVLGGDDELINSESSDDTSVIGLN